MKTSKIIIYSALLSLCLSFFYNGSGAWANIIFRLNLFDKEAEERAVRAEVRQYNINSAHFYDTAGEIKDGLEIIPAAPLLKRRLFKDINMLKGDGMIMVFDRDFDEIKKIYFPRRDIAVAETDEIWAIALQDLNTREFRSTVKGVELRARYLFKKEPFGSRGVIWVAYHVDVYPMDEVIPEINLKSVL